MQDDRRQARRLSAATGPAAACCGCCRPSAASRAACGSPRTAPLPIWPIRPIRPICRFDNRCVLYDLLALQSGPFALNGCVLHSAMLYGGRSHRTSGAVSRPMPRRFSPALVPGWSASVAGRHLVPSSGDRPAFRRWTTSGYDPGRLPPSEASFFLRLRVFFYFAHWQTVMAALPRMSSAEHPRERSLSGIANPCKTGP